MHSPRLHVILACVFLGACTPTTFSGQTDPRSAISAYRESFSDAAGSELVDSVQRNDLLTLISNGRNLWLGDHHRHSRLHALQTELLKQLQHRGMSMAFGLEAVGVRDEPLIRDFLANRIDLRTLRERMLARWPGSWLDDRDLDPWFYQSLLIMAKRHRIPVFALEPTPRLSLHSRDAYIAQTVARARERYPDRLIVTVLGQAHLLGQGDVIHRSGCRGVVIGGQPTTRLMAKSPTALPPGGCWRTDSEVLWFTEMFQVQ